MPNIREIKIGLINISTFRGNGITVLSEGSANFNRQLPVMAPSEVPTNDIAKI